MRIYENGWNHLCTVRACWLLLGDVTDRTAGRKRAVDAIFEGIKGLLAAAGTPQHYHVTRIYFWVQMVDLALHKPAGIGRQHDVGPPFSKPPSRGADSLFELRKANLDRFAAFLVENEFLLREELVTNFYSTHMLMTGAEEFVLPDKRQLPSILNFNVGD